MKRLVQSVQASPFLRHNMVFFFGSVIVGGLNYLYYPILGRLLQPADFGEVQVLMATFTQVAIFLSILSFVTIHVTVNTTDQTERNQLLTTMEHAATIIGGILVLIALAFTPAMRQFLHFSAVWPFVVVLLTIGISIPLVFRMAYLRGRKQFGKAVATDAVGSASKLVLSAVLVSVGLKALGALTGVLLSQVVALALVAWWAYRSGLRGWRTKPSVQHLRSIAPQLRHALALLVVSLYVIAIQTFDVIAIKHYFSPEQAGAYAGIATVANIAYFLTTPFTGVLISSISLQQTLRKNSLQLLTALILVAGIGGTVWLAMSLFPQQIMQLLIGRAYLRYSPYLWLVSLTMLLVAATNTLLMYHIALRNYTICITAVGGLALTAVLLYLRHDTILSIIHNMIITTTAIGGIAALQTIMHVSTKKGVPA